MPEDWCLVPVLPTLVAGALCADPATRTEGPVPCPVPKLTPAASAHASALPPGPGVSIRIQKSLSLDNHINLTGLHQTPPY